MSSNNKTTTGLELGILEVAISVSLGRRVFILQLSSRCSLGTSWGESINKYSDYCLFRNDIITVVLGSQKEQDVQIFH